MQLFFVTFSFADVVFNRFPRLTTMTGLEFRRCERDLSDLVSTFNLTSDTVTFRPNELPLLCLLLAFSYAYEFKLLSVNYKKLIFFFNKKVIVKRFYNQGKTNRGTRTSCDIRVLGALRTNAWAVTEFYLWTLWFIRRPKVIILTWHHFWLFNMFENKIRIQTVFIVLFTCDFVVVFYKDLLQMAKYFLQFSWFFKFLEKSLH